MKKVQFVIIAMLFVVLYTNAGAEDNLHYIWNIAYGTPSDEAASKISDVLSQEMAIKTNDNGGKFISHDIDLSVPTVVAGYQLSSMSCYFFRNNGFDTFANPNTDIEDNGTDGLTIMRLSWRFATDESTPEDYGLNAFISIVNQFALQYGGETTYYVVGNFSSSIYYCKANNADGSLDMDIARDLQSRRNDTNTYSIYAMNNNVIYSLMQLDSIISISMIERYYVPEIEQAHIGNYWEAIYTPTPKPISF